MARTSNEVKADIRQIDRRIDGISFELFRRSGRFNIRSFSAWALAWDRNPDLKERTSQLFSQRYALQEEREDAFNREFCAEQRRRNAAHRRAA